MGETETPHFSEFGIFGRVPSSQNLYYLSLETPGYPKYFKTNPKPFLGTLILGNFKTWEIDHFDKIEKTRVGNPADPSNDFLKILNRRSRSFRKT